MSEFPKRRPDDLPVDVDTGQVRLGRILVQTSPAATVLLSFGTRDDLFAKGESSHSAQCARILQVLDDHGAKYNPGQPRIPAGQPGGGEWTSGGSANAPVDDGLLQDIAAPWWATPKDKQDFVDAHLTAAQEVAHDIQVPVENILGVSAVESDWGRSRIAHDANNFFGMHEGAFLSNGKIPSLSGTAYVSTYDQPADSFASFGMDKGHLVKGVSDPVLFVQRLQNHGGFAVNENGTQVSSYVKGVASTIRGIRPYIARRSP